MISIYLLIALVCAILLLIMAAMGDFGGDADFDFDVDGDIDFDVGHGDFGGAGISPLSVPILLVFGTCFGSVGSILEALGWNANLVPVVAVGVSLAVTVATFIVMVRVFVKTQGSTAVGLSDLVGLEGLTLIGVTRAGPGQVVVATEERGRVVAPAVARYDIPTNSQIKVIGVVGDSVMIERINEPMEVKT